MKARLGTATLALCAIGTIAHAPAALSQTVEEFYKKNNTIDILIGFGPGTGYDSWFRPIGKYMKKHMPGNPTFVIKNMPGAGSLTAANHLYNNAPKDGTVLGSFSRNLPSQAMLGLENVKFDPRKLSWIGSPELPIRVCAAMVKTGINSVEDLQKKELVVGGTGPGTAPTFMPALLNQVAGTRFKVIDGYQSASAVYLAMARGEVDGVCQTHSSLTRGAADMFKSKQIKILFNVESQRSQLLNGTPSIHEYVKRPEDKQLLDFINASTELGRPLAAPPGIPADRLAALRKAFQSALSDPEFLQDAAKQKLDIDLTSGEELSRRVTNLYEIPKSVVARANALMGTAK